MTILLQRRHKVGHLLGSIPVSFFTGKRGDWHAVCTADGDTDFRKCAVVSGAFVPESDLSKDRIPVRGRGAVGGVRPVI